jgi:hypothetical protein
VNYFLIKGAKFSIGFRKKWTPVRNRVFQLLPASVHGTPRLSTTGSTILNGKVMVLSFIHSQWRIQFNENLFLFQGKTLVLHLQILGILPKSHDCHKCRLPMRLYSHSAWADGCYWCCRRKNPKKPKTPCQRSNSLRCDTWFSRSHFSLAELVISH